MDFCHICVFFLVLFFCFVFWFLFFVVVVVVVVVVVCVCVCVCVCAHVLEFGSLHTNMHVKCSMLSIVNIQCDFLVLFGLKPDSYDVLYL